MKLMPQLVAEALDRYQQAMNLNGQLPGISTGFYRLDDLTGGFIPKNLWVIGGSTSDGKSAFTLQMLASSASRGEPVCLYTFEMPDDEEVDRLFAHYSSTSSQSFRRGKFTGEQFKAITRTSKALLNLPLYIRDVDGKKLSSLIADMRLMKRRHKIKVFAIDYLQLVSPDQRGHNREAEVAEISRRLKGLAKNMGVTILVLSQLNDDGRLRESRAIGMDGDVVLTISVPVREDKEPDDTRRTLYLSKNRNGERHKVIHFAFNGATFTFKET